MRRVKGARQGELPLVEHRWGGPRAGAGRKANKQRREPAHRARPEHKARHPVHVVLRTRREVVSQNAVRNRRLNELLRDVELDENPDTLDIRPIDVDAVRDVFTRLQFRTLQDRVLKLAAERDGAVATAEHPASELEVRSGLTAAQLGEWLERERAANPLGIGLVLVFGESGLAEAGLGGADSAVVVRPDADGDAAAPFFEWLASDAPKTVFVAKPALKLAIARGIEIGGELHDGQLAAFLGNPTGVRTSILKPCFSSALRKWRIRFGVRCSTRIRACPTTSTSHPAILFAGKRSSSGISSTCHSGLSSVRTITSNAKRLSPSGSSSTLCRSKTTPRLIRRSSPFIFAFAVSRVLMRRRSPASIASATGHGLKARTLRARTAAGCDQSSFASAFSSLCA